MRALRRADANYWRVRRLTPLRMYNVRVDDVPAARDLLRTYLSDMMVSAETSISWCLTVDPQKCIMCCNVDRQGNK